MPRRRRTPPPSPFTTLFNNIADTIADAGDTILDAIMDHAIPQQEIPPGLKGERKAKAPGGRGKKRAGAVTPRAGRATAQAASVQREDTLYDVLEVAPRCSPETLSAAFRSLSSKYHPDKQNPNLTITNREECMKAITAAWSVLKDPAKRKEYDRSIGLQ